jgi:hypothetical protein
MVVYRRVRRDRSRSADVKQDLVSADKVDRFLDSRPTLIEPRERYGLPALSFEPIRRMPYGYKSFFVTVSGGSPLRTTSIGYR